MSEPVDDLYSAWSGPRDGFQTAGCMSKRKSSNNTLPPVSDEELEAIAAVYRKAGLTGGQIRSIMTVFPRVKHAAPTSDSFPDGIGPETNRTESEAREQIKLHRSAA